MPQAGFILKDLGAGGEGGHQLALVVEDEGSGDGRVGGRVKHSKGARDLASLVLHQGDGQLLQGGASKLPEMGNSFVGQLGKHTN